MRRCRLAGDGRCGCGLPASEPVGQKIKREGRDGLTLSLAQTPDILAEVGRPAGLVKVGFAAESQDLLENAAAKLEAKDLDLIVANDITATDAGFAVDTNRVTMLDRKGQKEDLPLLTKYEVGCRILARAAELIEEIS
jgi:phosphopantothenoylcysteine decarboxylase/phosphopantothenate--cysteine ligase